MKNKEKTIKLTNINKVYPNNVHAIFDFNLEIKNKEFIVFVGPSGCGKTTTLRMIAGLEDISYGELNFDGKVMNAIPPKNREIAMVFQNYALYPHMSVYKNMANGLRLRKVPENVIQEKILKASKMLNIDHYLNRKPKDLSGGQRQRVALGRAIVREPRLFLMDEPLSNLDAKLRGEMRAQIRELHDKLNTTSVYVTHDQVEAMTMADRVVIMNDGFIEQVGTPDELYSKPANLFVAKFIGTSEMNTISGSIKNHVFNSNGIKIKLDKKISSANNLKNDQAVIFGFRPSDVHLIDTPVAMTHKGSKFKAKIKHVENLGERKIIQAIIDGTTTEIRAIINDKYSFESIKIGTTQEFYINLSRVHLFDPKTEYNLDLELNTETLKAREVKELRVNDQKRKHEIISIQSKKKTLKEKIYATSIGRAKKLIKRKK